MTPQEIFNLTKRTARMGTPGDNTDQAALDCLSWLNNRSFEIWDFHSWDWSLDTISLNVSSSSYELSLPSTAGEIKILNIQGEQGYLRRYNHRDYLEWQKQENVGDTGTLIGYIPLGRDSSGNIKVRFFDPPSNPTVVEGWAKKRITALTSADLTTTIPFFPVDVHDLLYTFVLADAFRQMGDARFGETYGEAKRRLKELAGDVESEADLELTTPPPDYITFTSRNRGSGSQVV